MRFSSKSLLSQTEPYVRLPPKATAVVRRNELACCADFVAEVFCPSECVRLIQDQASMSNVDSRIHSPRFDCCVFLFYSFSAVTFATKSAASGSRRAGGLCRGFGSRHVGWLF